MDRDAIERTLGAAVRNGGGAMVQGQVYIDDVTALLAEVDRLTERVRELEHKYMSS